MLRVRDEALGNVGLKEIRFFEWKKVGFKVKLNAEQAGATKEGDPGKLVQVPISN